MIGVGLPVKVSFGENVSTPVAALTLQVPSFATTNKSKLPLALVSVPPVILTVVATTASPVVSLLTTAMVTGAVNVLLTVSSVATGKVSIGT